ncbi:hypothetical protein ACRAWD_02575 [Caulobacter segnis]
MSPWLFPGLKGLGLPAVCLKALEEEVEAIERAMAQRRAIFLTFIPTSRSFTAARWSG